MLLYTALFAGNIVYEKSGFFSSVLFTNAVLQCMGIIQFLFAH